MTAAIYARKSTEQIGVAEESKSVARQIAHAREYATRKGWSIDEASVYVDDGISGAEFARRPGFVRLMAALKPRPPFHVLIMSEESRLGREAIETAYALKQLVTAGVRVFFYLEDRERTLDSPTDKIMLSLTAFADELEREKARQRTTDAMVRKARAGYVTGGRVFGCDNVRESNGVRRVINEREADVVRRIFQMASLGHGLTSIAKLLNDDGAISPRAQCGRPAGWAPSSVREVLHRLLYHGEVVWNRTRKRDKWGVKSQRPRPADEWIRHLAADLAIVPDELWNAAHRQMQAQRDRYDRTSRRGAPPWGIEARYMLTGLMRCWRRYRSPKPIARSTRPCRVLRVLGASPPRQERLRERTHGADGARRQCSAVGPETNLAAPSSARGGGATRRAASVAAD
jgi:site-specific DNA recombinase